MYQISKNIPNKYVKQNTIYNINPLVNQISMEKYFNDNNSDDNLKKIDNLDNKNEGNSQINKTNDTYKSSATILNSLNQYVYQIHDNNFCEDNKSKINNKCNNVINHENNNHIFPLSNQFKNSEKSEINNNFTNNENPNNNFNKISQNSRDTYKEIVKLNELWKEKMNYTVSHLNEKHIKDISELENKINNLNQRNFEIFIQAENEKRYYVSQIEQYKKKEKEFTEKIFEYKVILKNLHCSKINPNEITKEVTTHKINFKNIHAIDIF